MDQCLIFKFISALRVTIHIFQVIWNHIDITHCSYGMSGDLLLPEWMRRVVSLFQKAKVHSFVDIVIIFVPESKSH